MVIIFVKKKKKKNDFSTQLCVYAHTLKKIDEGVSLCMEHIDWNDYKGYMQRKDWFYYFSEFPFNRLILKNVLIKKNYLCGIIK